MTKIPASHKAKKSPRAISTGDGTAPLVSVIIPTFRRHELLAKALRSVRAQAYRPLQLIVVDDDSDPATGRVVEETVSDAANIEVVMLSQANLGPAAARNLGLAAAQGSFIQFLDDDDELFPTKISNQVAFLGGSDADIVFGDWIQGQDIPSARSFEAVECSNHFIFLTSVGWAPNFAYLARSRVCREVGGWNAALRFNDDFDFFLRLAARGAVFRRQTQATGFYRWHPGPRVSSGDRRLRLETNIAVIENAERLKRDSAGFSASDIEALIKYWRKLATEAAYDAEMFNLCANAIDRLRREIRFEPTLLEKIVGARQFHLMQAIGGPKQWGRWLAHAMLPLSFRRALRRIENGVRTEMK